MTINRLHAAFMVLAALFAFTVPASQATAQNLQYVYAPTGAYAPVNYTTGVATPNANIRVVAIDPHTGLVAGYPIASYGTKGNGGFKADRSSAYYNRHGTYDRSLSSRYNGQSRYYRTASHQNHFRFGRNYRHRSAYEGVPMQYVKTEDNPRHDAPLAFGDDYAFARGVSDTNNNTGRPIGGVNRMRTDLGMSFLSRQN